MIVAYRKGFKRPPGRLFSVFSVILQLQYISLKITTKLLMIDYSSSLKDYEKAVNKSTGQGIDKKKGIQYFFFEEKEEEVIMRIRNSQYISICITVKSSWLEQL